MPLRKVKLTTSVELREHLLSVLELLYFYKWLCLSNWFYLVDLKNIDMYIEHLLSKMKSIMQMQLETKF